MGNIFNELDLTALLEAKKILDAGEELNKFIETIKTIENKNA